MTPVSADMLIVVGGYSTDSDWNNNTYFYHPKQNVWDVFPRTAGAVPVGQSLRLCLQIETACFVFIYDTLYLEKSFYPGFWVQLSITLV